jgi:hypothetical protein
VLNMPTNSTLTIDFWGVQVEAGNVSTAFQTATGTLQGELALAESYYAKGQLIAIVNETADGGGNYRSYGQVVLPVTMRTSPTITINSKVANTLNKLTTNYYASVYGGSQADTSGSASAGDIATDSFVIRGINSTYGKYDACNWTASAEL